MDALGHAFRYTLAVLGCGFLRRLGSQVIVLVGLGLVLRGSHPDQRPGLLAAFAGCLPYLVGDPALADRDPSGRRQSVR